jgi:ketosteroid isomerase-like protein
MTMTSKLLTTLLIMNGFLAASSQTLRATDSAPADHPQTSHCSGGDYHQFDFWLGDWDVFELDSGKHDATVRVDRALDGCAVREQYYDDGGMRGESLSIYDSTRNVWHQSWFTNRGRYLAIEGHLESGSMVLAGTYKDANGVSTQVRGTWSPSGKDVRETAILSTDQGNTWKPWFDLIFRPRNEATSGDDAKIVGALDTEFQSAVKNNDAATMARILADDFILVTGSGKTQTKADLLEESRSGQIHYEHQEDTEQTVRVWGDTAVVTAKLWGKGTNQGKTFDSTLWFSDTYVRTPSGWRYVFGQASLPMPAH